MLLVNMWQYFDVCMLWFLAENRPNPSTVADVLSPPAYPNTSCLVGGARHTPVAERRQKKRRVTINSSVLHHSFDNHGQYDLCLMLA